MELDPSPSSPSAQPSTSTPASRIAELNDIDQSISTLLSAASDAIRILSNRSTPVAYDNALQNADSARIAFTEAAETYFSTLSSIEVRLRRQVYALEEANLIRSGDDRETRKGRALGGDTGITNVGGGPLDPGWLNARASDKVGAGMKRELLAQAMGFVEQSARQTRNPNVRDEETGPIKGNAGDEDQEMG